MVTIAQDLFVNMSFRQFNNIVGRLTESTKFHPYFPIRPVPLNKAEPPKPMFNILKTAAARTAGAIPAARTGTANIASKVGPTPGKSGFDSDIIMKGQEHLQEHLKRQYIQMQTNIHEPVYLKGGAKDKILFGITLALSAYLAVDSFTFMWQYRNYK